ncbi:Golgi resident protein GCP60 [Amphibalanus amphitrite]|uniref:Golgi resident protein GCP60 n=1 Tax=Amphibalanus amphitrite TaxID=1232801 RepID=A0A6A4V953_AMPAM|nr:Golgi resident protein GCP60 [Amphibalanus amphitrite]
MGNPTQGTSGTKAEDGAGTTPGNPAAVGGEEEYYDVVSQYGTAGNQRPRLEVLGANTEKEGKALQLSYAARMEFVSLTQQVAHGPCRPDTLPQLGVLDIVGRDRREAWQRLGDMSRPDSMVRYIEMLDAACPIFRPFAEAHRRDLEAQERRSAAGQAGRLLPAEHSGTGWQLRQLLCGSGSDRLQSQQPEPAWSFIDALFFCLTVVTTIGYGQLSPRTAGGQLFCLLYALVGIPISGLLLAGLSDLLAGHLLSFYHTSWAKRHGRSKRLRRLPAQYSLALVQRF